MVGDDILALVAKYVYQGLMHPIGESWIFLEEEKKEIDFSTGTKVRKNNPQNFF
jgi:hypothetical protein